MTTAAQAPGLPLAAQAPAHSPRLSILDLLFFMTGVAPVLLWTGTRGLILTEGSYLPGSLPMAVALIVIRFMRLIVEGIAVGILLHFLRRCWKGERHLLSQPGHWLFLLTVLSLLTSEGGKLFYLYRGIWLQFVNLDALASNPKDPWLLPVVIAFYAILVVVGLVGPGLVLVGLRRRTSSGLWWLAVAGFALVWSFRNAGELLTHIWMFARVGMPLRTALGWAEPIELLAMVAFALLPLVWDWRRGTKRDWLHHLGASLWIAESGLFVAERTARLVAMLLI